MANVFVLGTGIACLTGLLIVGAVIWAISANKSAQKK